MRLNGISGSRYMIVQLQNVTHGVTNRRKVGLGDDSIGNVLAGRTSTTDTLTVRTNTVQDIQLIMNRIPEDSLVTFGKTDTLVLRMRVTSVLIKSDLSNQPGRCIDLPVYIS